MPNPLTIPTSPAKANDLREASQKTAAPIFSVFDFIFEDRPTATTIKDKVKATVGGVLDPIVKDETELRDKLPLEAKPYATGASAIQALFNMAVDIAPGAPIDALDFAGGLGIGLGMLQDALRLKRTKVFKETGQLTNLFKNGEAEDVIEIMVGKYGEEARRDSEDAIGLWMSNLTDMNERPVEDILEEVDNNFRSIRGLGDIAVEQETGMKNVEITKEVETSAPQMRTTANPETEAVQEEVKQSIADSIVADMSNYSTPEGVERINTQIKDLTDARANLLNKEGVKETDVLKLDKEIAQLKVIQGEAGRMAEQYGGGSHDGSLKLPDIDEFFKHLEAERATIQLNDFIRETPVAQSAIARTKSTIDKVLIGSDSGKLTKKGAARASVRDLFSSKGGGISEKDVEYYTGRLKEAFSPVNRGKERHIKSFAKDLRNLMQRSEAEPVLKRMVMDGKIKQAQGIAIRNWLYDKGMPPAKAWSLRSLGEEKLKELLTDFEKYAVERKSIGTKKGKLMWDKGKG